MNTLKEPQLIVTLTYESDSRQSSTTTSLNAYGTTRDELTDEYLKDFVRACGFYVGVDEELFFRDQGS